MQFNERVNEMISHISKFFHFSDPHQKDDINRKAFDKFKKEHGVVPQADNATPSERFEGNSLLLFCEQEVLAMYLLSVQTDQP